MHKQTLERELTSLLHVIDQAILELAEEAEALGCTAVQIRDADGNQKAAPLLSAKAQALSALAALS